MNKKLILLTSAAILCLGNISESRAVTCTWNGTKLTVTGIGGEEFTGCPDNSHQSATEVTFKEGITSIGDGAFYNAISLKSVDLPNVTSIGANAFAYTTSLQSVDMPNVTSIGQYAFANTSSLQSIDMPNVTSIGSYAFNTSTSLQSVDMPNVTSIGGSVFSNSPLLTNIIIPDDVNVNNWGANAFGSAFTNNENSIITCLGNVVTCKTELGKKYGEAIVDKVQPASDTQCNSSVNYYYSSSGCVKLPTTQDNCTSAGFSWVSDKCTKNAPTTPSGGDAGGSQASEQQGSQVSGSATSAADCKNNGQYWQEGKCVSSCGPSFKLNDGWCDRQRYTPAEAAKYLNDDDNFVVITFKK